MLSRLGDRVAAHPRRTLLGLLAFLLVAGVLGGPVAGLLRDSGGFAPADSGSERTDRRIEAATGAQAAPGLVLLVATPHGADTPAAQARLAGLRRELAARPGIASVVPTATTRDERFVSRDGRLAYLAATVKAGADESAVTADVLHRFDGERDVTVGGSLAADQQIGDSVSKDLGTAETLAFPLLLLLSLLFFRGRATVLPLLVGITTVLGTFLVLRVVNEAYGLSIFALNLVIGLGLGLAIDYTLFLVTRFREELARSGPGTTAIRATMTSAGRTIVFSAATVAAALATLVVFPLNFLQSMGIAGAAVAVVAAVASLTVTPALLALWGAKLAVRPRRRARAETQGGWYRLSKAVMRRPGVVAVAAAALMLAVALPALRTTWSPVDSSVIPKDTSARTVSDALATRFAGQDTEPLTVALTAPAAEADGVRAYASGLERLPGVARVNPPRRLDATTWQIDVDVRGDATSPRARALVTTIREGDGAYPVLVGGSAAAFVDQQAAIGSRLVLAALLLAGLTCLILWLMTGSVVLPLKAVVMNVLTVGAALGVLTLVFQDGRFTGLLGYTPNGGIEPTDFLVSAALVFALSTDYGVFLLGRIRETRESGVPDREAVAVGLERTGAVVTAAAILLAVAIGAFVTSSISFLQQIGVATAAGVLLDAFVVRSLLVPALMGLLGRWNWWSPAPLRRLHDRIGLREGPGPAGPAPAHG